MLNNRKNNMNFKIFVYAAALIFMANAGVQTPRNGSSTESTKQTWSSSTLSSHSSSSEKNKTTISSDSRGREPKETKSWQEKKRESDVLSCKSEGPLPNGTTVICADRPKERNHKSENSNSTSGTKDE